MILHAKHGDDHYKWVEKGNRATLIKNETRQLWWGDPADGVPPDIAPLAVLLEFSTRRVDRV